MTHDHLDLDALKTLIAAMTCPAPWRGGMHGDEPCLLDARDWDFGFAFFREDRDAIIALRNAAPALIAAARERDEWQHRESETQEALQAIAEEFGGLGGEVRVDCVLRLLTEDRAEITSLREALEAAEPIVASDVRAREALERKLDAFANGLRGIAHADQGRDALAKVRAALTSSAPVAARKA